MTSNRQRPAQESRRIATTSGSISPDDDRRQAGGSGTVAPSAGAARSASSIRCWVPTRCARRRPERIRRRTVSGLRRTRRAASGTVTKVVTCYYICTKPPSSGEPSKLDTVGDIWKLQIPAWDLVLRSVVIYAALFAALRLFGKRQVGQFTVFDLVLVLLIANAVQPAMTGPDSSLLGGLIIIAALILVNYAVSRLDRTRFFHRILQPQPAVIIKDGSYLEDVMRRENVDLDECETAIREHGMDSVGDVKLGVLEPDGTISIVPTDARTVHTRRRVRYRHR